MRLLVCGGRAFDRPDFLNGVLDSIHAQTPITTIIEGGARGADRLAGEWADATGVKRLTVPADWERYGKAAGAIRNQRMLDEARPDRVLAFPGGRGTEDMIRRARAANVPVRVLL